MKVRIVVTREKDHYGAEILGFPTVTADGRTAAQARRNALKAVRLYLRAVSQGVAAPKKVGDTVRIVNASL